MFAVHALWSPGQGVILWAEDGDRPATGSSRALRSARPHPFAVPAATLAGVHPGTPTQVTLLLPSRGAGPLPSPELVRSAPAPTPRGEPELRAWAVPAVVVDPAELDDPADELRYGASVAHLREMVALADDLTARGRVLPTLDPPGPDRPARARWRPVVQGLDAAAVEELVAATPPVARAERTPSGGARNAAALVADALDVLVDAAARHRLARAGAAHRGGRTVVDAFLTALTSTDSRVADGTGLDALAEALREWDAVGTESPGAARAVFRLAEVRALDDAEDDTGDGTRWRLEFLLQSTSDPSLLVPAERVWAGAADRLIAGPQEVLLAELGRAARVHPPLVAALRRARPEALDLDPDGAHHVLVTGAALLVEAGFGVQLPAGWDGGRRVGLRLSARSTPAAGVVVRGGLGREEVADFRWSVAVGDGADAVLDEEEIAALVAAKAPLVRLRGAWVSVDQDQLRKGLEFLRRGGGRRPSAADVLALAAGFPDEHDLPLPLTGVDADGWLGDLLTGSAERTLTPIDPPPAFAALLRPYQQRGVAWLAFLSSLGLGACLADDMGLGKTVQLLALESHDRAHHHPGPTLLLCPMSMVGTWEREAARFAPDLRVRAHHGGGRARGDDLAALARDTDLLVTTYATAARDADDLAAVDWHRLVLDEAQAVKNARSLPARAVRRFPARHRIALTGTPVENRLAELWAIMDVLNPGILGTAERFRTRYAVPIERHGDTDAAELLRRTTRPYLLRRLKTDPTVVDDLPEKIEITQHYRLTREQASLYRTIVDDMLEKIEGSDGIERRGNVLAAMTKLKQVCNHPAQLLHDGSPVGRRSGKVLRLEEILTEVVAEGDRALCFTQFTEFGHLLLPHLSARLDTDVAFLHGGLPRRRREEIVKRFQDGDGPPVLLLSLKAGGSGLTLTAATHVVHLDRWWNPAVEEQATDRAFRIGQRRTVQVRKFLCPGTVEERIDALVRSKRTLSELVVGDGEGWLTELSTATLRELFALGSDALADAEDLEDSAPPVRAAG